MRLAQFCGAVRGSAEWLRPQWRVKATAGIGCYVSPDEEVSLSNVLNNISEYLTYTLSLIHICSAYWSVLPFSARRTNGP